MNYGAEVMGLEPHGLSLNPGFPCPSSIIARLFHRSMPQLPHLENGGNTMSDGRWED